MSKVKLISYTKSIGEDMDLQQLVAYVARVSNPANQHNDETAPKLINYLIKHKHWSPLEMADATVEIETTRDIGRQILRHRSFSFQEFSQRYADPTKDLFFVIREARLQDDKNRQNSIELEDSPLEESLQPILVKEWAAHQQKVLKATEEAYKWATDHNIAKEQARSVLPEGLMGSRMYMKGSLRSWVHYIQVRTDPTTQKEHREIAHECADEISKVFPLIKEFVQG